MTKFWFKLSNFKPCICVYLHDRSVLVRCVTPDLQNARCSKLLGPGQTPCQQNVNVVPHYCCAGGNGTWNKASSNEGRCYVGRGKKCEEEVGGMGWEDVKLWGRFFNRPLWYVYLYMYIDIYYCLFHHGLRSSYMQSSFWWARWGANRGEVVRSRGWMEGQPNGKSGFWVIFIYSVSVDRMHMLSSAASWVPVWYSHLHTFNCLAFFFFLPIFGQAEVKCQARGLGGGHLDDSN